MLRALILGLALVVTPAVAEDFDPETLIELIRADDRAGVDAFLNDAHEAFIEGTLSADKVRALFIALSRTHPKTTRFVREWAETSPDNASALYARALSIWHAV